jgi:hypothetical protein
MGRQPTSPLGSLVSRLIPGVRYPWLVAILAGLLAVDLVVPDPIPLLDEVMLAVLTVLAASWRTRSEDDDRPPPKDVTPPEEIEPRELERPAEPESGAAPSTDGG